jgi:hypothetical protein
MATTRARAQTRTDDSVAAEALFTAGRADVERGDFASACPKFAESERLDPAAGTVINLADCEEHLGHLARSWQLWREAVERLGADDVRRPAVAARAEAIDRRVPRLTIKHGRNVPPGTTIRRDDDELATRLVDVPVPVDPGEHVVLVDCEGFITGRYVIHLSEGAHETVAVEVGPPVPAAPAPRVAPRAESSPRWIGFALLGVGALGAGIGTVTGLAAIDRKDVEEKNCFPEKVCTPAGADAASEGRTLALTSTIGFVAAAVAIAGGVFFIVRSAGSRRVSLGSGGIVFQ